MKEVSFVLDGASVATLTGQPYQYFWQLAPGRHTLEAVGVAVSGETLRSEPLTFIVNP
jgi:hypothetical protein